MMAAASSNFENGLHDPAAYAAAGPASDTPANAGRPHLLPTDLPKALKWLATEELATLAAAVAAELQRRGPLPEEQEEPSAAAVSSRELKGETNVRGLTKSQVSAIRASFNAGVRLAAIGRQFGVSQAAVRSALAGSK
jgi:hypothetical protein